MVAYIGRIAAAGSPRALIEQYSTREVVEVLLTDDSDFANGSAGGLPYDAIHLFVTGPDDMSAQIVKQVRMELEEVLQLLRR